MTGMQMRRNDGSPPADSPDVAAARSEMVAVVRAYGVRDERVLAALGAVRRHRFFPGAAPAPLLAYGDHPCPIGWGQTISQPYIVAYMTERLSLRRGERVLEIGTGSGYQAAVLAALGARVWTVETVPELAAHAARVLAAEGYDQVRVKCGDGYAGWVEDSPFDAILVTCAPASVPAGLMAQLGDGGRMMVPVGVGIQRLVRIRRRGNQTDSEDDLPVRFVPMVRPAPS